MGIATLFDEDFIGTTLLDDNFDVATVVGRGMDLIVATLAEEGGFGGLVVGAGGFKLSLILRGLMGIGSSCTFAWIVVVVEVTAVVDAAVMADKLSSFKAVLSLKCKLVAVIDDVVPLFGRVRGSIVVVAVVAVVVVNEELSGSEVVGLAGSS